MAKPGSPLFELLDVRLFDIILLSSAALDSITRSNYILATEPVSIHAIGSSDHFHLDTHGFCTINAKTSLSVRKRDDRFPSDEVAIVTHEQPACLAHSDYSNAGALLQLSASFPGQEEHFQDKEYDIVK
ncbi:MAG: hypothetical protein Q9207_006010 [Kuettlingeria erythrocarpa]